VIYLLQNKH